MVHTVCDTEFNQENGSFQQPHFRVGITYVIIKCFKMNLNTIHFLTSSFTLLYLRIVQFII